MKTTCSHAVRKGGGSRKCCALTIGPNSQKPFSSVQLKSQALSLPAACLSEMSAMDSEAVFDGRLKAVGLWEFKAQFLEAGFVTLGGYACGTTTANGNLDDNKFATDVLEPVLGRADHPKKVACKRLFPEAFAMFAADLSKRASGLEDDEKPRKIPTLEKGTRLSWVIY